MVQAWSVWLVFLGLSFFAVTPGPSGVDPVGAMRLQAPAPLHSYGPEGPLTG